MTDFLTYKERLEYLQELIEKNRKATPEALAAKFGVSKRTIRRMVDNLRLTGVEVKYDRKTKKYCC